MTIQNSGSFYISEWSLYLRVVIFGLLIFALSYFFTSSQKIANPLNKAVADTSILLIGLSMILSSICYFLNFMSFTLVYRKHLGLIGFAFALVHLWLSIEAFWYLFEVQTWQQGAYLPALTGLVAMIIFGFMSVISNRFFVSLLGGRVWKLLLRTGYIAMIFVLAHVLLLKLVRWQTWYEAGMKTLPSTSLIVTGIIILFLCLRLMLSIALRVRNSR